MRRHLIIESLERKESFDIPDDIRVLINWDNIPEISFLFLHNRDIKYFNKLEILNNQIHTFDKMAIKKVILQITKEQSIEFVIPILSICYRTVDYMAGNSFRNEEILSIKFCPEQSVLIGYDSAGMKKICCDFKNCQFLINGKCDKYQTELEPYLNTYLICKQCYCSMGNVIANKELQEEYEKMRGKK